MTTKNKNLTNLFSVRHSRHNGFSIDWDEKKAPGLASITCRCGERAMVNIETQQVEKIIPTGKKVVIKRARKPLRCRHTGVCKDSCRCECDICIITITARKQGKESVKEMKRKLGITV